MKSSKKALALALAAAMAITGVPVTDAGAATTAKLSATKATIYVGGSKTVSVSAPKSWKSVKISKVTTSKKSVATAKKTSTKKFKVTAVKAGTATVKVKVTYKKSAKKSAKTYSKTLSFKAKVKNPTISVSPERKTILVDDTFRITANPVPSSAKVTYSVDNKDVVRVSKNGNVRGLKAGTAKITVSAKYGTKTLTPKVVEVTVDNTVADGITAKLTNESFPENYPGVVADKAARIRVTYGENKKPVSNEYVHVKTSANGDFYVKTDANGVVYFDITYPGVKKVTYTVIPESANDAQENPDLKCEGTVTFAHVDYSSVANVNGYDGSSKKLNGSDTTNYKKAGYNALQVSINDSKGTGSGDGTTRTAATYTHKEADAKGIMTTKYINEYVDSQQVSATGTTDNKVGFKGGLPTITLPGDNSTINTATTFKQDVNLSSKIEGTYADDLQYVTLDADPNELTYASMNFANLTLSKYTRLEIKAFPSKEDAESATPHQIGTTTTVYGKTSQSNFTYQIPLSAGTYSSMCLQIRLKSQGQIESPSNTGYTVKDITGVYKNKNNGTDGKTEILKGAKIEWKTVAPQFSEERVLDDTTIDTLKLADKVAVKKGDMDEAAKKIVEKATYKVPVFPYTGNAVITTYDKNGDVIAYYACPTLNGADKNTNGYVEEKTEGVVNTNVLAVTSGALTEWYVSNGTAVTGTAIGKPATGADYVYRISEEEANKTSVGTIIDQKEDLVTVNSTEAGVTCLEGTITGVSGLDATNEKVYTSVQWNPVKPKEADHTGAIAFAGQIAKVTAQLVDKNGNEVATANEDIKFSYDKGDITTAGQNLTTAVSSAAVTAQALSVDKTTNSKGQAELTLTAAKKDAVLTGIKADNKEYNVRLLVDGQQVEKLDLYFVEAQPAYVPSATEEEFKALKDKEVVSKEAFDLCTPTIGETWQYGFKAYSDALPNAGVWANKSVGVSGAKITVSAESGSKGTVSPASTNGSVIANSKEPGVTTLSAIIDGTPADNNGITFSVKDNGNHKSIGTGATSFENEQKLEIKWKSEGINGTFMNVNGVNAVTDQPITLYFKVQDKLGNKDQTEPVKIASSVSTEALVVSGATVKNATSASVITGSAVTGDIYADNHGIIAITVPTSNAIGLADGAKEVISVTLNKVVYTAYITWKAPVDSANVVTLDALRVDPNKDLTKDNPYRTYADAEKIVLTFNKDILASSVREEQFEVGRQSETVPSKYTSCKIDSVSVSGKTITIKLANKVTDGKDLPFQVKITPKTIDSITYDVTTAKTGERLGTKIAIIGSATCTTAPAFVSL